jgi:hypothetical protein
MCSAFDPRRWNLGTRVGVKGRDGGVTRTVGCALVLLLAATVIYAQPSRKAHSYTTPGVVEQIPTSATVIANHPRPPEP